MYKRQPTKGYTEDNVQLVWAQVNMMKSDMSLEAVSYTHLDVYKRQIESMPATYKFL